MPKYLNLLTDFAFKKIFADPKNKHILIDLLNTFLKEEQFITDLIFMNTEQLGKSKQHRSIIYDLYCTDQHGDHFLIEVQQAPHSHFLDRILYYSSNLIRNQGVRKKKWNYELKTVYTVALMNFIHTEWKTGDEKFYYKFRHSDEEVPELQFKKSVTILVELPKFRKRAADDVHSHFEKWMYILANIEQLDQKPPTLTEPVFMDLLEKAEFENLSKEERLRYERELKIYRDNYSAMEYAKTTGFQEGFQEGIEKGEQRKLVELILEGFALGLSIHILSKQSKLSEDEVIRIIESNK